MIALRWDASTNVRPSRHQSVRARRMPGGVEYVRIYFMDFLALVDKQLEAEPLVPDSMESNPVVGVWRRGNDSVELHPSTSTGVLLLAATNGQVIHERIFAASEISVPRIARAITEHLTGYVAAK